MERGMVCLWLWNASNPKQVREGAIASTAISSPLQPSPHHQPCTPFHPACTIHNHLWSKKGKYQYLFHSFYISLALPPSKYRYSLSVPSFLTFILSPSCHLTVCLRSVICNVAWELMSRYWLLVLVSGELKHILHTESGHDLKETIISLCYKQYKT